MPINCITFLTLLFLFGFGQVQSFLVMYHKPRFPEIETKVNDGTIEEYENLNGTYKRFVSDEEKSTCQNPNYFSFRWLRCSLIPNK
eukprot:12218.XXX_835493_835182_1 [CDS] Oithona nana genome sequencing.